MDNYHILLTPRARDDILEIGTYITYVLLEPDTSRNFIQGLRKSINQLAFFPYKFPLIQDEILRSRSVRCMPYKNYFIFYEILEMRRIVILRIGYNKRDWKNI